MAERDGTFRMAANDTFFSPLPPPGMSFVEITGRRRLWRLKMKDFKFLQYTPPMWPPYIYIKYQYIIV